MRRLLTTTGALAVAGLLGATGAGAKPAIDSVEIDRVSKKRAEVVVELARGTTAAAPRVTVRVGKRTLRVPVRDWDPTLASDEIITASRVIPARARVGKRLKVRVRACDTGGCVGTARRVTVFPSGSATGTSSLDDAVPLPDGAIDLVGALDVALEAEPDAQPIKVEREDDYGAAWEVRLQRATRIGVKVYIDADGAIVRTRVEGISGHRRAFPPLPEGAAGPEVAVAAAIAHVGGGTAYELKRSRRPGTTWKVEVVTDSLAEYEVFVDAAGVVVGAELDDDERDDDRLPPPEGAIGPVEAAAAAVAHLGGGVAREVERTSRDGAVWKVEVRMADRTEYDVYVGADGSIIGAYRDGPDRDDDGSGDDDRRPAPPAGAVTPQESAAAAVAHLGGGVAREVERTIRYGAVWKVEVRMADRTEYDVYVGADGTVVRSELDD